MRDVDGKQEGCGIKVGKCNKSGTNNAFGHRVTKSPEASGFKLHH